MLFLAALVDFLMVSALKIYFSLSFFRAGREGLALNLSCTVVPMRLRRSEPVVEWDEGKGDFNSCFSSPHPVPLRDWPPSPCTSLPTPALQIYCTHPCITDSLHQILVEVSTLKHCYSGQSRQKCGILNYMLGCRRGCILATVGSPQEKSLSYRMRGSVF